MSFPKSADGFIIFSPGEADLGGTSHWSGSSFDATAGTSTDHDVVLAEDCKLIEGTVWCDSNVANGDTIDLYIVDVDDVLGYGPGAVLRHYVETFPVVGGERRRFRSGQAADLAAGLYMRTRYTSTGGTDVCVKIDWLVIE